MTIAMKDFYKILGVKETASEEEIRARWVELTKHYHPDRGEDIASNEKIREVNEAYQILKHSSTRVEYDLKRTYGPQKREGKRGSYFKKLGIPAGILFVFIIIGVVHIKNSQSPPVSELTVPSPINHRNERAQTNQKDLSREMPLGLLSHRDQINQNDVPAQQPKIAKAAPAVPIKQDQTDQINQRNQIDQIDLPRLPRKEAVRGEMPFNLLSHRDQIDQKNQTGQIDQTDLKIELAQFKPPSLLATEGEVKKFFDNYIEHYNQMDLEGFLSLFSSKAIQNKKDGLEGIRKVYTIFFNQGKEVRCRFWDMKIEIYQNVVEVKARYEIIQILINSENRGFWKGQIQWVLVKEKEAFKIVSLDYQHD